jgi:hypothetical protein
MRYLFGLLCVCALGLVPLLGCSDTTGDGGSGGFAGTGGTGGEGGTGGDGGTGVACVDNVCPCTEAGIRAAIEAGGDDAYTFDCDGPQTVVTAEEIVIDNDVILDGEGKLTVDGNGDHRVFSVTTGITVALRGMTVTGGAAQNGGGQVCPQGGGIYSEGTLMLTDSTVSENGGNCGAGIFNGGSGTMTLANSTVSRNWAATFGWGLGAGIYNEGEMSIINSTISENQGSHAPGGGIYNATSGTLSLIKSTVSKNDSSADGPGHGGGIYNGGEMTIMNSTVSQNRVLGLFGGGFGGGIYSSGWMLLINTTVSSNTANGVGGGFGGGIYSSGWMLLINTTVSSNTANGVGGGIYSWGWMSLTNTTVANNLADSADAIYIGTGWAVNEGAAYLEVARTVIHGNCGKDTEAGPSVTWVSLDYNIESPGDTCGFDQATDQVDVSAAALALEPLADNGGPTETHALLPGSVAIDVIPADMCEVYEDQRGFPRDSMCDVGAFEVQP